MERRHFLKSLFAVAGSLGAAALLPEPALAMPISHASKDEPIAAPALQPAVATPEDIDGARIENVRWYGRRRRRYFFRRRRVIYRRRRFARRAYRRRYYY